MGKKITWKKLKSEQGKQQHLPYNIEAVGKHIKWGKGEMDGHFGEENKDFKLGAGKLSSCRELYTSLPYIPQWTKCTYDLPVGE